MAETSYPFAADTAGGGGKLVSDVQWQAMSHLWGPDRIDFQLTASSYATSEMPFYPNLVGSDISVGAGAAWVGGFYYKNDSPWVKPAPTNSGAQPRVDLVVIRADMSAGSVNLAIKTGAPAANPVEPAVQRTPGGIWEMPICAIRCEANNGARTIGERRRFDVPGMVSSPWNGKEVLEGMPPGAFNLDMDANQNDTQSESFLGRDGYMITRHLGRRRSWTPDLLSASNKPPTANRAGYWRRTAPGTVAFSFEIRNSSSTACKASAMVATLPVQAGNIIPTILKGMIVNPERRDGLPNFVEVVAKTTTTGNNNLYLYITGFKTLGEGLNAMTILPGKSTLSVSGEYETNEFEG